MYRAESTFTSLVKPIFSLLRLFFFFLREHKNANRRISDFFPLSCFLSAFFILCSLVCVFFFFWCFLCVQNLFVKTNKEFKTTLITSFILLLTEVQRENCKTIVKCNLDHNWANYSTISNKKATQILNL